MTGLVAGDGIVASYTSIAMTRTAIGTYSSTSPEAITPTLADPNGKLGNYAVTSTNAALTITPATLAVTANAGTKAYGAGNPAFAGTLTGMAVGEHIFAIYSAPRRLPRPPEHTMSKPEVMCRHSPIQQ